MSFCLRNVWDDLYFAPKVLQLQKGFPRSTPFLHNPFSPRKRPVVCTGFAVRTDSPPGETLPSTLLRRLRALMGYPYVRCSQLKPAMGCATYGASSAATSSLDSFTPSAPTAVSRCSIFVAPTMGAVTASFWSSQARAI